MVKINGIILFLAGRMKTLEKVATNTNIFKEKIHLSKYSSVTFRVLYVSMLQIKMDKTQGDCDKTRKI